MTWGLPKETNEAFCPWFFFHPNNPTSLPLLLYVRARGQVMTINASLLAILIVQVRDVHKWRVACGPCGPSAPFAHAKIGLIAFIRKFLHDFRITRTSCVIARYFLSRWYPNQLAPVQGVGCHPSGRAPALGDRSLPCIGYRLSNIASAASEYFPGADRAWTVA